MTGNKYLLDTNIISAIFKGDISVAKNILTSTNVFIPVIATGELFFGASLSNNSTRYLNDIHEITLSYSVININQDTCKHYGLIKSSLRKKGKPIPENDIWIAAIALQYNFIIVTKDNHFKEVEEVEIEAW